MKRIALLVLPLVIFMIGLIVVIRIGKHDIEQALSHNDFVITARYRGVVWNHSTIYGMVRIGLKYDVAFDVGEYRGDMGAYLFSMMPNYGSIMPFY